MSAPTFTVLIPALNERELVGWAIRSVQAQTRTDWELIVVDDGSTDGTPDAVRPFVEADPRIRLISQSHGGLSVARNAGIEGSQGRLVSFLDSDDMWLPRYLDAMGTALDSTPSAGLAYTDAWTMDAETHKFRRATVMSVYDPLRDPPLDPDKFLTLLMYNFLFASTTVRREALVAAGPFDPSLRSYEDYDMWIRILRCGFAAVWVRAVLAVKRERENAMSRNELLLAESGIEVYGRVVRDETISSRTRTLAESQIKNLERWRSALSGESRALALALAARRRLGVLKRRMIGRRAWLSEPPAEVQEAFPDLQRQ